MLHQLLELAEAHAEERIERRLHAGALFDFADGAAACSDAGKVCRGIAVINNFCARPGSCQDSPNIPASVADKRRVQQCLRLQTAARHTQSLSDAHCLLGAQHRNVVQLAVAARVLCLPHPVVARKARTSFSKLVQLHSHLCLTASKQGVAVRAGTVLVAGRAGGIDDVAAVPCAATEACVPLQRQAAGIKNVRDHGMMGIMNIGAWLA